MEVESAFPSEFPTVLADDTLAPSPYQAALFHFRQGMQALCSLAPGAEPRRRAAREELISMLRDVLKLLHLHFAPESEDIATRPFGDVLRQHRDEAGLTQEQLADYAGVSLSLLRKLEQGSKEPSRSSVLALCSVPDLKLVPQEITTSVSYTHLAPECGGKEDGERERRGEESDGDEASQTEALF